MKFLPKPGFIGLLIVLVVVLSCKEQKTKVVTSSDIYKSFSIKYKASLFNVPPGIVALFLDESKPGNIALKDLLKDVNQLSFLIIDNHNSLSNDCVYLNEISSKLDSISFYDIAQYNNSREIVRVKVDKKRRHFNEIIVLVSNRDALYCISFKGKIPSKKVINLVKPENVGAVTNLDRFKH